MLSLDYHFPLDPRDDRTDFQDCEPNVTISPVPHWNENEVLSTNYGDPNHLLPSQLFQINQELLQSGVISLCGMSYIINGVLKEIKIHVNSMF